MCLAIPGRIVEIYEEHGLRMGKLDFGGTVRGLGRGGLRGLLQLWASSGCRTGGVAALRGITMNDAIMRHCRESIGVKGGFSHAQAEARRM